MVDLMRSKDSEAIIAGIIDDISLSLPDEIGVDESTIYLLGHPHGIVILIDSDGTLYAGDQLYDCMSYDNFGKSYDLHDPDSLSEVAKDITNRFKQWKSSNS